jgi:clan AA aspartic protease
MGTFSYPVTVSDLQGRRSVELEAQVDTGATYLVLPRPILERLGVAPTGQRPFRLGDGSRTVLPVANVLLRLNGESNPVLCVFAPEGSAPLLGAVPLETFGLAVDPVGQRLVPVDGLLLSLFVRREGRLRRLCPVLY